MALKGLLLLLHGLWVLRNRNTQWERERHWRAFGHVSASTCTYMDDPLLSEQTTRLSLPSCPLLEQATGLSGFTDGLTGWISTTTSCCSPPGKDNVDADFLSRSAAEPTSAAKQPEANIESDLVQLVYETLRAAVSLEELKRESAADPLFVTLSTYIQNGWPARVNADLTPFSRVRAELTCWGESCIARGHRAVIPLSLRGQVLSMAHEGHVGLVKLKQRCRDLVWWPGIDRELEALVRDCAPCLLSGKTGAPAPPPLQPVDWPTKPLEHLQMDIYGELASVPHHQRFLVVVYDLHSKWPEVVPMCSVTASAMVDFLEQLFSRWGIPQAITTDKGPQFVSSEFSSYLAARGIAHIRTAFYHPQANGGVERLIKVWKWHTCTPCPRFPI